MLFNEFDRETDYEVERDEEEGKKPHTPKGHRVQQHTLILLVASHS
jgi:hypothetical protein